MLVHQKNVCFQQELTHLMSFFCSSMGAGSSFTVEFRDSSNSHSQVEGTSASASGVEFQITQGSSSIMPSTAMSDSEEAKEGAGRDGALEHVRMLCF